MVRTQIQLTEDQAERLRMLATERGLSMAELVRDSIDRFLEASPRSLSREDLRDRARKLAGRFSSGVTDLAAEHDTHLAAIYGE